MKVLKKLFSGILNTSTDRTEPRAGYLYAVTGGRYLGEFFVYIEKVKGSFYFLSLPKMEVRQVPYHKCKLGIKDRILDEIEKLPKDIYEVCVTQYRKSKDEL